MISRFRRTLFTSALRRSLAKRAPSRFSYSASNDYYVPTIAKRDGSEVLIDGLDDNAISGRSWNGDRFEDTETIGYSELDRCGFQADRFYGFSRTSYASLKEFWWAELTKKVERQWAVEQIRQFFYNKTTRFRHDRIEVLRKLV